MNHNWNEVVPCNSITTFCSIIVLVGLFKTVHIIYFFQCTCNAVVWAKLMTHHFIVIEIKNALLISSFIFQLLKNITKMDQKKFFVKLFLLDKFCSWITFNLLVNVWIFSTPWLQWHFRCEKKFAQEELKVGSRYEIQVSSCLPCK